MDTLMRNMRVAFIICAWIFIAPLAVGDDFGVLLDHYEAKLLHRGGTTFGSVQCNADPTKDQKFPAQQSATFSFDAKYPCPIAFNALAVNGKVSFGAPGSITIDPSKPDSKGLFQFTLQTNAIFTGSNTHDLFKIWLTDGCGGDKSDFFAAGALSMPLSVNSSCQQVVTYSQLTSSATFTIDTVVRFILAKNDPSDVFELQLTGYFKISNTCPAVAVDHIEIVQATQDALNSIPLIANKPSVARVFFRLADPPQPPVSGVTGVLRGVRENGEAPRSPQGAFNSGPVIVQNVVRRDIQEQSLNFELPPEWIGEGKLDLTVEATAPPCGARSTKIPGIKPGADTLSASFTSILGTGRNTFRIGWIPFCYLNDKDCPKEELIPAYDYLLKKWYPIAPDNVQFAQLDIPKQPPLTDYVTDDTGASSRFKAYLVKLSSLSEGKYVDQLVGILPPSGSDLEGSSTPSYPEDLIPAALAKLDILNLLEIDDHPAGGKAMYVVQRKLDLDYLPLKNVLNPTHYNGNTLAHEMAHNLGRRHTNKPSTQYGNKNCGDEDKLSGKFIWPYDTADIQEVGFDPATKELIPSNAGDFMSYCSLKGIEDWVSPFTYTSLAKGHLKPIGSRFQGSRRLQPSSNVSRNQALLSIAGSQIVLSGWAGKDRVSGKLDPAYKVMSADPPDPSFSGGSHCLRFSGAAGPLSDFCFHLNFLDPEHYQPLDKEYFALKVALPEGTTRISLMAGSNEIANLSMSSAAPALSIVSPKSGEQWTGGQRTISWSASSSDGLPLVFTVLYAADGGLSWLPAAIDLTGTQFTFDPSQIEGGKNVMFRVMASDGLNTSTVDVGPVDVVQKPALQMDSTLINFGDQAVGSSAEQALSIKNPGTGPLRVTTAGPDNSLFTVNPGNLSVPAGATRTLTIRWRVAATGAISTALHLTTNDPSAPKNDIVIQGNGVLPALEVSAKRLDFGNVNLNQVSELPLFLTNKGPGVLTVQSISPPDAPFSLVNAPSAPFNVGDASTRILVRFSPTTAGAGQTGKLTIASNDPNSPTVIELLGNGVTTGGGGGTGGSGIPGPNLIQNPGAEVAPLPASANTCQALTAITGWTTDGKMMVCPYTTSFLTPNGGLPTNRGNYFFTSGTGSGAETRTLSQTIDLGGDKGGVGYTLGGWFGGYGGRDDSAALRVSFRGTNGTLGTDAAGPVTSADRSNQTKFLERTKTGTLPAGTRSVLVEVVFNLVSAGNDAYADNLAFALNDGSTAGGGTGGTGTALQFSLNGIDAGGRVNFLGVNVGQSSTVTLTVKNPGTTAVTVNTVSSTNTVFSASPQSFTIDAGGTTPFAVSFAPKIEGAQQSVLMLNLVGGGTATLNLSGSGVAVPVINVSPLNFNFGNVNVGANPAATAQVFVSNRGTGLLTIQSVTIAGAGYTLVSPPGTPFNAGDAATLITVGFSPAVVGTNLRGTLTIGGNDPANPSVIVNLIGNGVAATGGGATTSTQLLVDNGGYDNTVGFNQGVATAYFVNRLTPPRYPATLRSVQIGFADEANTLPAGAGITILSGKNSGSSNINNVALTRTAAQIAGVGRFNTFDVAAVTIDSGDFIVGFSTANPPNIFPMTVDTQSASQRRSYLGTDGAVFTLLDDLPGLGGNFLIRATVDLGTSPGTGGTGGGTGTPGQNLIQNSGAEAPPLPASANTCQALPAITGWNTDGKIMVCPYTAGFLTPNGGLPNNRGNYFFSSGAGSGAEVRTLNQTIELGADKGGIGYTLGGWFGGYGGRDDNTKLRVTFRGTSGVLGTDTVGPVTSQDRANQTKFLERTKTGTLPAGTRSVLVEVVFTLVSAGNDTYSDNLFFALNDGSGGSGGTGGASNGLVGDWPLNDAPVIKDFSGLNNEGVAQGGVTKESSNGGFVLRFDSTGLIRGNTPGTGFPTGNSPRTLAAFVEFIPSSNIMKIFEYGAADSAPDSSFGLYMVDGARLAFGPSPQSAVKTLALVPGGIHLITAVYEGAPTNRVRIYIDGPPPDGSPVKLAADGVLNVAPNTRLGANWKIGEAFVGRLSGVRFYNRALSGPDITSVFAGVPKSAVMSLSTSKLDFGNVSIGQTKDSTFTIRNDGTADLVVDPLQASAAFSVILPIGGFRLPPGGQQLVTVRFTPAVQGAAAGSLLITSNDLFTARFSLPLNGTGVAAAAPVILVAPTSLDFGNVTVGQTKDLTINVSNAGNAPLTVTQVSSGNPRFTMSSGGVPGTISSVVVTLRFTPTAAGAQSGVFTMFSNDPAHPSVTVSLTGTGVGAAAPAISVTPTSLSFGDVNVGQSKDLTLRVSNVGNAPLTVSQLGSTNARFTLVSGALPGQVGNGITATIRFTPNAAGTQSGTLTLVSNDPVRPSVTVSLSGNGVAAEIPLIRTLATLDFGNVKVGQSKEIYFLVNNDGTGSLIVTSITGVSAPFSPGVAASTYLCPLGAVVMEVSMYVFRQLHCLRLIKRW